MKSFIISGNISFSTESKELKTLSGYVVCKTENMRVFLMKYLFDI